MVKSTQDLPHQLNEIVCNIDIVYTRTNLYVKTQNKWVEVHFHYCHCNVGKKVNEIIMHDKYKFCINIVFTDKNLPYWSYYLDIKNINQTLRIFKDFKYRIEHDESSNGFLNKQTITDMLWIYMFYVCTYPLEKLRICNDE